MVVLAFPFRFVQIRGHAAVSIRLRLEQVRV
jgi:hypothetical protein